MKRRPARVTREAQGPGPRARRRLAAAAVVLALGTSVLPVGAPGAAAAAGTISGRVTMPDGSAIDGNVAIDIFTDSGWNDFEVVTPSAPTFSFTPWGADDFYFRLAYSGPDADIADEYYLPGTLDPEEAEAVAFTGTSIVLDLRLFVGGYGSAPTIAGQVLTTAGDEPPDWLDVTACPVGGGPCAEAAAPPSYFPRGGVFTIVAPGAGEYRLCFHPRPSSNLIASCGTEPDESTVVVAAGQHVTGIVGRVVLGGQVEGEVFAQIEPPGGPLVGVVGAVVRLFRDEDGPDAEAVAEQVVTAADGSFAFFAVPPGDYAVYADTRSASGGLPPLVSAYYSDALTWADRTVVEVESGETTRRVYLLVDQALGEVTGTVGYDDGGIRYLRDAKVELWSQDSGTLKLVATDRTYDGMFSFSRVPVGSYIVRVEPSGAFVPNVPFVPLNAEYWTDAKYARDADPVVVENRSVVSLDFVLDRRSLDTSRVTGADRFETAVEVAQEIVPIGEVPADGIPVVYLANGLNYPDALAAGPAAIQNDGVVLLSLPWSLPAVVREELERLHPQRIVVVGGIPSIDASVYASLRAFVDSPADLVRITGQDRFGTSRAIAVDTTESADVAFIATGMNYPDALAAGPPAGMLGAPIILVNGAASTVDAATLALLHDLGVDEIYVIGGTPSVSAGIFAHLQREFGSLHVTRLTGNDRFETAQVLARTFYSDTDVAHLATGLNFPDALAGGPAAGHLGGPLLLSRQDCLTAGAMQAALDLHANGLVLLGGPPSLSMNVENGIVC